MTLTKSWLYCLCLVSRGNGVRLCPTEKPVSGRRSSFQFFSMFVPFPLVPDDVFSCVGYFNFSRMFAFPCQAWLNRKVNLGFSSVLTQRLCINSIWNPNFGITVPQYYFFAAVGACRSGNQKLMYGTRKKKWPEILRQRVQECHQLRR
jgi:hypothetical protein